MQHYPGERHVRVGLVAEAFCCRPAKASICRALEVCTCALKPIKRLAKAPCLTHSSLIQVLPAQEGRVLGNRNLGRQQSHCETKTESETKGARKYKPEEQLLTMKKSVLLQDRERGRKESKRAAGRKAGRKEGRKEGTKDGRKERDILALQRT